MNNTKPKQSQPSFKERLGRRRVPVILQTSSTDCGVACLAMILHYHGRKTTMAECLERIGSGRDGSKARVIAKVARDFGLRVKAYSAEPEHFKYIQLPALIHWEFNHYLVVERWSSKKVDVVDPAIGGRQLTTEEFDAGFTGVVLTFEPNMHFESRSDVDANTSAGIFRPYLKYMFGRTGVYGVIAQILGTSLLLQAFGLGLPVFTKIIVDQVLPFRITNVMSILGIGILILVLAQTVTSYLRAALFIYLQARLDSQMMLGIFDHLLTLPYTFFQTRTSGDILSRMNSNSAIREILTNQVLSAILDGGLVIVYSVILFILAPFFAILALTMAILQVLLMLSTASRVGDLLQKDLKAQAETQSYVVEALNGIATLKASGAEDRAFDHWSNLFFKQLNISLQRNHLSALINTSTNMLNTLAPLILLWVGTGSVLNGSMSLGTMLALHSLATAFLSPISSLVTTAQQAQVGMAHMRRILDVLQAKPEQEPQHVQTAPPLMGRIELQNVSFQYNPHLPYVLRHICLTIEPGQKVAIVGPTGSGKSTLGMLLLGLYQPTEGQILYDGISLLELNYRTLRSQFGVVLQDPFLFSGSVRQNISFNNPELSMEQIMEATRLAAMHDEVMQMPMGYETIVAEGGSSFSGGQRQRLSLARALANQPVILLLDEATSHLDVETERVVDQHLTQLSCTRIVIAHRLSTIRNADCILVLHEGQIVERGTHEQLLKRNGHYADLIRNQLETEHTEVIPHIYNNGFHKEGFLLTHNEL